MKKLATTIGLLTLMLIVTSFTTPNEPGNQGSPRDKGIIVPSTSFDLGNQGVPRDRSLSYDNEPGNQGTPKDRGVIIGGGFQNELGNQGAPRDKTIANNI